MFLWFSYGFPILHAGKHHPKRPSGESGRKRCPSPPGDAGLSMLAMWQNHRKMDENMVGFLWDLIQ